MFPRRFLAPPILGSALTVLAVVVPLKAQDATPVQPRDTGVQASCSDAAHRASDYVLGRWSGTVKIPADDGTMVVDSTVRSSSELQRAAGGCAIVEWRVVDRDGRDPTRILTVRAFDPDVGRWRQWLVSSRPAVLRFRDGGGEGTGLRFVAPRDREGLVRVTDRPAGEAGFDRIIEGSEDGGETWTLEDVVEYRRPGRETAEGEVRAALEDYLRAHATGRGEYKERVFHPDASLRFVSDGELRTLTVAEYVARSPGKPADDEARRRRRIASVDVTGNAAVARVELDYPDVFVTDYMSLLEVDGEWKIVGKIAYVSPRGE